MNKQTTSHSNYTMNESLTVFSLGQLARSVDDTTASNRRLCRCHVTKECRANFDVMATLIHLPRQYKPLLFISLRLRPRVMTPLAFVHSQTRHTPFPLLEIS